MIAWAPDGACSGGVSSDFTITVTATDSDTTPENLTFSGSVSGCSGSLSAAASTITCPNAGTYSGSVTVTDPEDNSDMEAFSFGPCETGSQ